VLRQFRGSYRLHNLLDFAAQMAAADGLARAALRVQQESVDVSERTGSPAFVAEATLADAQLQAAGGDAAGAARSLARARAPAAAITNPRVGEWMAAMRQIAEAGLLLPADPARATGALDSAAAFFKRMNAPLLALPPTVDGARVRLARGDTAGAVRRLAAALAILEHRRDSIRMEPRRAATFEAARGVVDRVAMIRLAEGRVADALAIVDRGRASLASAGAGAEAGAGGVAGPPGEVAVEYALVGDELLAWTIRGSRVDLYRARADTTWLKRTAEHLLQRLESGAGEAELRPGLARLYDRLVRPIESRLGPAAAPLVVIADGEIASIPFAALFDARRGRYLVQDRPLRYAVSLREARRRPSTGARRDAVFVADPAFDAAREPDFGRLPAAAREVREVAAGYAGARVLGGAAATREAVLRSMESARLLHYAGHAVFDDERPEQSYLLLAPGQSGGRGTLQAGEIAQLELRNVSLVVLSACRTVRTGGGRAAGFSGLAGAFLAAGAGGAVGSLWEVDDRLTRPLMIEFHHAYRLTGNGPAALRAAQLRLLGSRDGRLRSPAAWAGFRYAGS